MANATDALTLPRDLHFYTPHFSKDIEITAPSEPDPAHHAMFATVSNWSEFHVVIHQGPTKADPPIAAARFHRKRATLGVGNPSQPETRWLDMHNENTFGSPRFILTIPGESGARTFRWERTRDGDDGVPGKHYRMKDTGTGHVIALYVLGGSSRKGRLIYRETMPREQALLVLISFISVIVKGRRSSASSAGAAATGAAAAGAGGGGA